MPAAKIDIDIDQGSLFNPIYTWTDDDGVVIDITNWTGKMDIREQRSKNSPSIFTCSTANNNLDIIGPSGIIRPKILATETDQFDFNWAYYDIELTPPAGPGYKKRVVEGKVTLKRQTTD